jgi:hypothetical protein
MNGGFFGRDVGCVSCSIRRTLGFLELELLTATKVSGGCWRMVFFSFFLEIPALPTYLHALEIKSTGACK